jgi:ATP-dependent Clp protease ATP-binding subunit ClpB
VNQTLRPELVGRMTGKVVFARLPYAVQREICESMIAGELARLRGLGHEITITPDDVETILRAGFHRTLGARPMRGAVERFLQDKIAAGLLGNE